MVMLSPVLVKLFFLSFEIGLLSQTPPYKSTDVSFPNSENIIESDLKLKLRNNVPENIKYLPDPNKIPPPSATEPLPKESTSDSTNSIPSGVTHQKRHKHQPKISFNDRTFEGCESSIFEYLNVKLFETQNLEVEPKVTIKSFYNSLPIDDVEVSYKEEKRKVIILVPVEQEEEREVLVWTNITEETIDKNNCKKLITKLIQVPTIKKLKKIEMVPQEFEAVVKTPIFSQTQTSITVETLTGIQVTVPQLTTKIGVIPNQINGQIFTPRPINFDFSKP